MGACCSKDLDNQAKLKNYRVDSIQNKTTNKKYLPSFPSESVPIQNLKQNQEEHKQMKWIQQILCHQKEEDLISKKQKIHMVTGSQNVNFFKAIGRVICVFNDDIVYYEKSFYYGTGSIINQRTVLTAAHVLRHGVLNVLANYVYFQLQSDPDKPKQYIKVKRYGFHRNFIQYDKNGKDKQSQKHDIAVLILEENNLITSQMTLGVQLNYKFLQQAHSETLVSGYPNHLNLGNQSFKQFWTQIKPSNVSQNLLFYQNKLGGGFSGSPLMIRKTNKSRINVFAVHKGQTASKGYSVCLNSPSNKLNQLLKHLSIEDINNQSQFKNSNIRVLEFKNKIKQEEDKVFYQSQVLFLDNIRWSRQIQNKVELNQFLQKLQEADNFKRGMQEIKFKIYIKFKQEDQQNRCLFRFTQWKYFFELFKNIYLNNQEQEKLLNFLLRMVNLNFRFDSKIDYIQQFTQIGSKLHYFWNSVHFKTRTWCKQYKENTQTDLNQKTQNLNIEINNIIEKGYQHQIDFKQRKKQRNEYLLMFYYYSHNLEKADKLAHSISKAQQQENPRILFIKGQIILSLNDLQNAQEYFNKCLKLVQKNGIAEDLYKQANVFHQLGRVYQDKNKYKDSLAFYKRSLQIKEQIQGKDSICCASTLMNMGEVYLRQRKDEDALAFFKNSLQIFEKVNGKDSLDCANPLNNIGLIYLVQGKYDDAFAFFKRSLQIIEKVNGKDSIDCVEALNNMGVIQFNQCKYDDAFVFYKRSLQIVERVKGKDSIQCTNPLTNLGNIYCNQNKYEDALAYYQRTFQIHERVKGKDSIECTKILINMGNIYKNQGKYQEAFSLYKRSRQICDTVKGENSIESAEIFYNTGLIYSDQENYSDALSYFNRSLSIFIKEKKKYSIECANLLINMGNIYFAQEQYEEALDSFQTSLQIYEKVKGQDSIECANSLINMGNLYFDQKEYEDALTCYKRSIQICEKVKGKDSIECSNSLIMIGNIYCNQGNNEDALAYFNRSLKIFERVQGKDSIEFINTLINMGNNFSEQDMYEDALVYYKRSLQITERVKGKDSTDYFSILSYIAQTQQSIISYST